MLQFDALVQPKIHTKRPSFRTHRLARKRPGNPTLPAAHFVPACIRSMVAKGKRMLPVSILVTCFHEVRGGSGEGHRTVGKEDYHGSPKGALSRAGVGNLEEH